MFASRGYAAPAVGSRVLSGLAFSCCVSALSGHARASLTIEGELECPSPAEVSERVGEILSLPPKPLSEHGELARDASRLEIRLVAQDGRLIGERVLDVDGECAELVRVTAVILATWLSLEHPEFVSHLPQDTERAVPPSAPGVDERPKDAAREHPPASERVSPTSDRPFRETARSPHQLGFGMGLGAGFSGRHWAPTLSGFGTYLPWPALGFELGASLTGTRSEPLGSGRVLWTRWPLELGAVLRVSRGDPVFDVGAGAMLGWLRVSGDRFDVNHERSAVVPGVHASARVGLRLGPIEPFVTGKALVWLEDSQVFASPTGPEAALPRLEVVFLAGARWAVRTSGSRALTGHANDESTPQGF